MSALSLHSVPNRIQKAFSACAERYDKLGALQRGIGQDLLGRIPRTRVYSRILDVGMGTGWLTERLRRRFPDAGIVGVDFAEGMIDCARKRCRALSFVQADAVRLPFKPEVFDRIVSNLAYQWVEPLPEAFRQAYLVLKKGGVFDLTIFGRKTLSELFDCLRDTLGTDEGDKVFAIRRLPSSEQVAAAMTQAGFQDVELDKKTVRLAFPDMVALVRWLKDTGANALERNFFVGRERLARANARYAEKYRQGPGVYASFETMWVRGERPLNLMTKGFEGDG